MPGPLHAPVLKLKSRERARVECENKPLRHDAQQLFIVDNRRRLLDVPPLSKLLGPSVHIWN